MTDSGLEISVVLPVKNGEEFLAQAIESILEQSHPPTELIVVDGRSTDRSAEIALSYEGVTLIEQSGDGLSQAWNQAVEASSGGLIGFLDSDDYWLPGKLEAQVALLEEKTELAGVIGAARFVLAPGMPPPPGFRRELLDGEHVAPMPGTLLIRREVFDRIGYFDEEYRVAMDVDWFARVKDARLELGTITDVVLVKRFHPTNLSHSEPEIYRREMVRAMRDSAARQRPAQGS
jgi:glycosyltransferase involved in cell wall biosynthesis